MTDGSRLHTWSLTGIFVNQLKHSTWTQSTNSTSRSHICQRFAGFNQPNSSTWITSGHAFSAPQGHKKDQKREL